MEGQFYPRPDSNLESSGSYPLNTPTLTVGLSKTDLHVRVKNTAKRSLGPITKFNFQTANMENAYEMDDEIKKYIYIYFF